MLVRLMSRSRGRQFQEPTFAVAPSVLEQPDSAVRALLGLADALAHRPLIALSGVRAVHVDTNERQAGEATNRTDRPSTAARACRSRPSGLPVR